MQDGVYGICVRCYEDVSFVPDKKVYRFCPSCGKLLVRKSVSHELYAYAGDTHKTMFQFLTEDLGLSKRIANALSAKHLMKTSMFNIFSSERLIEETPGFGEKSLVAFDEACRNWKPE